MVNIDKKEREQLISKLLEELPVLRLKLSLSQDELANMIGISRPTYSSIETGKRKMNWSIFLSLILIFDKNSATHDWVRQANIFPKELLVNAGAANEVDVNVGAGTLKLQGLQNVLDSKAIHAIETVIMMEYARCNDMSGEAVIKAFEGKRLVEVTEKDIRVNAALKNIKARQK